MIRRLLLIAALLSAAPALAIQPGASGSIRLRDGAVELDNVDGGDSAGGTTRAANRPSIQLRGADTPTAQTDGLAREAIVDDLGVLYVCTGASCNASGWTRVQNWALMGGTLGSSQQVPWADVGLARAAAGVVRVTDGSSGRGDLEVVDLDTQAVTVSDNGNGGTAATFNLDPQKSYIEITCNDAQGCDGTVQETSAREGRLVTVQNVSANRVKFADQANVLVTQAGTIHLPQNASARLTYDGGAWVEPTMRVRIEVGDILVSNGDAATFDFDSRFSITCANGECEIVPGSQFTMLGSTIEANEMTSSVAHENEPNDFGANQQTIEKLDIEKADGTTIADCNISADGDCRYTGSYSHADSLATKSDVSARVSMLFDGWTQTHASNFATRRYLRDGVNNTLVLYTQQIVPIDCTMQTLHGHVTTFGSWPSGATITIGYIKNLVSTPLASCSFTASNTSCTSGTTNAFSAGERIAFYAECSGTCTDTGTTIYPIGSVLCTAN